MLCHECGLDALPTLSVRYRYCSIWSGAWVGIGVGFMEIMKEGKGIRCRCSRDDGSGYCGY